LRGFQSPAQVKAHEGTIVDFSPAVDGLLKELESFLFERVYKHPVTVASDTQGKRMIAELFAAFVARPVELPSRFASRIEEQGTARVIGDYIAGMTDRFCRREHERLAAK